MGVFNLVVQDIIIVLVPYLAGFVAKRDVVRVLVVEFFVGSGHRVCISAGSGKFFIQEWNLAIAIEVWPLTNISKYACF